MVDGPMPSPVVASMATTRSNAKRPRADDGRYTESRPPPPLRVSPRPTSAAGTGGVAAASVAKPDKLADDLHPSLMTERQQVAFLLRQSAQAMTASSDDSEDDRRPTRMSRQTKAPPAATPSAANKENETSRRRKAAAPKKPRPIARASVIDIPSSIKVDTARCCLCTSWTDSLFLCGHCDKKYPTQKALGHAV
ncbi:hypothetical protein AaE_009917 [Aphanomyces astaci]|uniref:Uncharacterized protein n=1 Tax=Aphanomyces astaci TaxID=112090 RepID=A0A6A5A927_APHAT|nr:hypothetical protein AaE_009917 [Aphanomyces astaci]